MHLMFPDNQDQNALCRHHSHPRRHNMTCLQIVYSFCSDCSCSLNRCGSGFFCRLPKNCFFCFFLKNLLLMSCGDYLTNRFCLNFPYFFHYGNCLNGRPKNFFGLSNVHFFPLLLLIVNSFCQNYRFCDGNDYLLLLQCHPCHQNICQKEFYVCLLRYIQKQYRDPAQNFSFFWTCVPLLPVHRRLHLLHRHHHSDPC